MEAWLLRHAFVSLMFRTATLLLYLFSSATAFAIPNPAEEDPLTFGKPIVYHNITLVPVETLASGPFRTYTLLEAGLEAKTLAVRELKGSSGDAEVNAVEIRNRGRHPVFLLSGEMILGGKQDRIIESDTIVQNDKRWHRVAVFCVEQGRWSGRKMKFIGGKSIAHAKLRSAALAGTQDGVWEEVARKNASHGTENETQTYRRTVQNEEIRRKIFTYRSELAKQLSKSKQMAGFVFAINGKIRLVDVLGNPMLFDQLKDKLLSAYILEALEHQIDPNAPKLKKGKAKSFYMDAAEMPAEEATKSGKAVNYKKRKKGVSGNDTVDEDTGKYLKRTYIAQ